MMSGCHYPPVLSWTNQRLLLHLAATSRSALSVLLDASETLILVEFARIPFFFLFLTFIPCGHSRPLVSVLFDVCLFHWLVILYSTHIFTSFNLYLLVSVFSTLCVFVFFFLPSPSPHLISLRLGTSPSALPPPPPRAPASVCIYSCGSIYWSFSANVLLLVINTRVKWSVTLPGPARRQRCIGGAGAVPRRLPRL